MIKPNLFYFIFLLFVLANGIHAQESVASGIKIVSEKNPDCSSVDNIVKGIIKPGMSDQQKAEAVFYYLVYRLYHYAYPQEPLSYSLIPRKASNEMVCVMDTVKNLNIYGHAICGSMSWYVNELFNAVGLFGRIDGVSGHTVPEAKYGGSWHYFDVDMMGFVRRKDGTVPSVDEIMKDKNLLFDKHDKQPDIFYKYDGAQGMWNCLDQGVRFSMYGRKIGIHSMNLTLREGETFNRFFKRQWAPKYRFYVPYWQNDYLNTVKQKKGEIEGPKKVETYYSYLESGAARFGNFELIYEAPLQKKSSLDGVYKLVNVIHDAKISGFKSEKPEAPSEVIYKFYSPYGCAGVPNDLSKQDDDTDGAILEGAFFNDKGTISVSLDLGLTWKDVHSVGGKFKLDLTPMLETKHCWLVKLGFSGANSGLHSFKSYISGQLSPASLPYTDGKTQMTFIRDNTDCMALFPDIGGGLETVNKEAFAVENYEAYDESKGNVGFKGMRGSITYKIDTPNDIVRIQAGAKFTRNRRATYSVLFSFDEGKTWILAAKQREVDEDEEHPDEFWGQSVEGIIDFDLKKAYSPGCIPGGESIKETKFDAKPSKTVLVKFETSKGWLCQVHGIYVHYKKPGALALKITHEWEGGKHEESIGATENEKKYMVNGGKLLENLAIKIEAPVQK